jgi:hypothetical protein
MASRQLLLISSPDQPWKLDEHTKAVGRAGVARARQALVTLAARPSSATARSAA